MNTAARCWQAIRPSCTRSTLRAARAVLPTRTLRGPLPSLAMSTTGAAKQQSKKKQVVPYGRWESPITADLLNQNALGFPEVHTFFSAQLHDGKLDAKNSDSEIVFAETRPQEKGRAALVRGGVGSGEKSTASLEHDVTNGKYNTRSGVQEYGGGAFSVGSDGSVIFTHYDPQKWDVYRIAPGADEPVKISPDNPAHRFAGFAPHPTEPHLILCILEDHTVDTPAKVVTTLALLDASAGTTTVLMSGADFYGPPVFNARGDRVAWAQWDHPSMPFWDTEVRVAAFDVQARKIVGESVPVPRGTAAERKPRSDQSDEGEVLIQPRWLPPPPAGSAAGSESGSDTLVFTSDRSGFPQLYSVDVRGRGAKLSVSRPELLTRELEEGDMQPPTWSIGTTSYTFLSRDHIAVIVGMGARDILAVIHLPSKNCLRLDSSLASFGGIAAVSGTSIVGIACWDDKPGALVSVDLSAAVAASERGQKTLALPDAAMHVLKRTSRVVSDGIVGSEYFGEPEEIEFPTTLPDGRKATAHALIYPPHNPLYEAPAGERPPCRLTIHGGPTSVSKAGLSLEDAYWTTRGWMICAVNYGGSTGYGREYMNRLTGQWGVVDVEDCVSAAKYLGSPQSSADAAAAKSALRAKTSSGKKAKGQDIYESPTAKEQLRNFETQTLPDGTVKLTLHKSGRDWGLFSLLTGAGAFALGATANQLLSSLPSTPGWTLVQGSVALAAALFVTQGSKVQKEVVKAVPGLGLQQETFRGFRWPWADHADAALTTSVSVSFTPRDKMVDLVVNEALKGWTVGTHVAAITASDKLVTLFPHLQPRLPLVQRIYQAVYPALFGNGASASATSRVDPKRTVISGGSAGGFTVLGALVQHPHAFSAGCSKYGVSELTALAEESHKFENRYPIRLVGGTPEEVPEIYHERSPLYKADRIRAPLLVQQGSLDKVVPPNQSEEIVNKMKENGGKVKYILFDGEGHGFRQAANRKRSLEEEIQWYNEVFGI